MLKKIGLILFILLFHTPIYAESFYNLRLVESSTHHYPEVDLLFHINSIEWDVLDHKSFERSDWEYSDTFYDLDEVCNIGQSYHHSKQGPTPCFDIEIIEVNNEKKLFPVSQTILRFHPSFKSLYLLVSYQSELPLSQFKDITVNIHDDNGIYNYNDDQAFYIDPNKFITDLRDNETQLKLTLNDVQNRIADSTKKLLDQPTKGVGNSDLEQVNQSMIDYANKSCRAEELSLVFKHKDDSAYYDAPAYSERCYYKTLAEWADRLYKMELNNEY